MQHSLQIQHFLWCRMAPQFSPFLLIEPAAFCSHCEFTRSVNLTENFMELAASKKTTQPLIELANTINIEHRLAESAAVAAIEHARNAGEALIHAKQQVEHGRWLAWLGENCGCSDRTAQRYMRLAREWPRLVESNATSVSHLSVSKALTLLTETSDELTDVNEFAPVPLPAVGHVTLGFTGNQEYVLVERRANDEQDTYYLTAYTKSEAIFIKKPIFGHSVDFVLRHLVPEWGPIEWEDRTVDEMIARGFDLGERSDSGLSKYYHRFYRAAWLYPDTGNPRLNELEHIVLTRFDLCEAGQEEDVVTALRTIRDEGLYRGPTAVFGSCETFDDYLQTRFENKTEADLMADIEMVCGARAKSPSGCLN